MLAPPRCPGKQTRGKTKAGTFEERPMLSQSTTAGTPALPFRYPEGRHGRAELRYQGEVPVLRVAGTPEEIGEQVGVLGVRAAPRMANYPDDLLRKFWL